MFCPRCGQERVSQETSFCSKCGYLLTGTAELLTTGGISQVLVSEGVSPRRRGVRTGIFMILLMFVLAPIVGLISEFGLGIDPWPVGIVIFGLGGGALLRIIYALMFESKYPAGLPAAQPLPNSGQPGFGPAAPTSALPPRQGFTASEFAGTHSTRQPATHEPEPFSITESTTCHLKKDAE